MKNEEKNFQISREKPQRVQIYKDIRMYIMVLKQIVSTIFSIVNFNVAIIILYSFHLHFTMEFPNPSFSPTSHKQLNIKLLIFSILLFLFLYILCRFFLRVIYNRFSALVYFVGKTHHHPSDDPKKLIFLFFCLPFLSWMKNPQNIVPPCAYFIVSNWKIRAISKGFCLFVCVCVSDWGKSGEWGGLFGWLCTLY